MHLKKLDISGFKSFAKATTLEFPSKITAIVGPNGSGKSNIAEAVRWVLGEQSIKSLRGKKGEDLIWNGSPELPRMGKALVTLVFDNRERRIPLEFEEVALARKIFRDGINEYYTNSSQVRLKDVVELMAQIGLGETKHNIIGQGEVDRLLLSSARERKEMLEEALGLKKYQLKKNEAERKLKSTMNNMRQVELLIREIAPHLKFLRTQAEKSKTSETLAHELSELQKIYFLKEAREIAKEHMLLEQERAPFLEKKETLAKDIQALQKNIAEAEETFSKKTASVSGDEKQILEYEAEMRELERKLGREEGKLEAEQNKATEPRITPVDTLYIEEELKKCLDESRDILAGEVEIETFRIRLTRLAEKLEKILGDITRGHVENTPRKRDTSQAQEMEAVIAALQKKRTDIAEKIALLADGRAQERERFYEYQKEIREYDTRLRSIQDEERDIMLALERFKFREERIRMREETLKSEKQAHGFSDETHASAPHEDYKDFSGAELKKKIERLILRLEEVGKIDPLVTKEYEETNARHEFLTREIQDLKTASRSLESLTQELEEHIKKDFHDGCAKIKEEFHNYFRIIFGGGRANLQLVKIPLRGTSQENESAEDSEIPERETTAYVEGIDISVDLPKKRIKELAMLSGGEKALTAIALLFAITAVSPPPFLILDETDAALDEANSRRYSAILKELAKKTQLILVTHNRETMKCASLLYGITMGNDGVSKLLSLKLEEAEVYTNR